VQGNITITSENTKIQGGERYGAKLVAGSIISLLIAWKRRTGEGNEIRTESKDLKGSLTYTFISRNPLHCS